MLAETGTDRREMALMLIERGWHKRRVAKTVGVSPQTIKRWTDPAQRERDKAASRAYKRANRDRLSAYDREYRTRIKAPCPACKHPMDPDTTLCRDCRCALAQTRNSVMIGCYEDGWLLREIADVLETNMNSLGVRLASLHASGELTYRYRVDEHGIRLPNAA